MAFRHGQCRWRRLDWFESVPSAGTLPQFVLSAAVNSTRHRHKQRHLPKSVGEVPLFSMKWRERSELL